MYQGFQKTIAVGASKIMQDRTRKENVDIAAMSTFFILPKLAGIRMDRVSICTKLLDPSLRKFQKIEKYRARQVQTVKDQFDLPAKVFFKCRMWYQFTCKPS